MERFHHFLYASHFILETDQKPLEVILSKVLIKQPQAAKDLNQSFSLPFHSVLHPWTNKSACWLLVPIGMSERYQNTAQITLVPDYKPAKCKKW